MKEQYVLCFWSIDNQQSRIPCNQQHIRQMAGQRSLGSSWVQGTEVLRSEHLPLGPHMDKSGSWSRLSHVLLSGMLQWPVPLGPFTCHWSFTLTSCQRCPPQGSVPRVSHQALLWYPGAHQAHTSSSLLSLSQMIMAGICLLLKDAGGMNCHCQQQQPYLGVSFLHHLPSSFTPASWEQLPKKLPAPKFLP